MDFTTRVDIPKQSFKLDYNSKIMLLGSCFSTEIGALLKDYRFNVMVNPFGVLYNPCSVVNSVEYLCSEKKFDLEDVIQTNPTDKVSPCKYASFAHHSSFSRTSVDEFLQNANEQMQTASDFLKQADTVIVTLGTSWVYRWKENGKIVSNCHKRLAQEFIRERLSVGEVVENLRKIVELLSGKRVIFTVSPIRHFKDGAHENTVSKATLLLAIEEIIEQCNLNEVVYFPSYEILMDELRDYRYYAEDMMHPSALAVKYIFERFKETYIPQSEYEQMRLNLKQTKKEGHIIK